MKLKLVRCKVKTNMKTLRTLNDKAYSKIMVIQISIPIELYLQLWEACNSVFGIVYVNAFNFLDNGSLERSSLSQVPLA